MTTEDTAFWSLTPSEIYQKLTGGPGARGLAKAQGETERERAKEEARAALIRSLALTIRSGWQGEASAGAYGSAMPLAERMLENSAKLDHSQDLLGRQIESFNAAVNSVRPVSDPPENSMFEPFPFEVDHDKAVRDYQSDAQHNLAIYRAYDDASHYNETNMPQEFHNTDRSSGNISVKAPADTIEVGEPGPANGGPREYSGPRDSGGPGGYRPVTDSPHHGGGPSGGHPGSLGNPPGGGSVAPGSGGSPTSPHDYRPEPSPRPLPAHSPAVQHSAGSGGGGFVGGVPFGGYPGGGGTAGGFGPRGGAPGGGAPGSGGPGAGGAGAAPRVYGPGAAVGAGAPAAEEAAARRAAHGAVGGRPAVGPVGAPVGPGRGKGDEDTEHERKVLIEADAEDTFGSDVLTAPQVIGDDEYED